MTSKMGFPTLCTRPNWIPKKKSKISVEGEQDPSLLGVMLDRVWTKIGPKSGAPWILFGHNGPPQTEPRFFFGHGDSAGVVATTRT